MKKTIFKYLSVSLALLLVFTVFASCNKNNSEDGTDADSVSDVVDTEADTEAKETTGDKPNDSTEINTESDTDGDTASADTEIDSSEDPDADTEEDTEPENAFGATGLEIRDFGGKTMQIWYTDNGVWAPTPLSVGNDELATGDIVSKAGNTRNKEMEKTFNLYLDYTVSHAEHSTANSKSAVTELRLLRNSGDTAKYDIIFASARASGWLSMEGFYYDLAESEYINQDAYYYESQVNEQIQLFGKQYFAMGYYSTQNTAAMSVMFANLGILESISGAEVTIDTLYEKALNHEWTMEYMLNLGKAYSTPSQNTGDYTTDGYAFIIPSSYDFPLYFDLGGTLVEYNENTGKYESTVMENQTLLSYLEEKLEKNVDVLMASESGGAPAAFMAGAAPFMYGSFYTLTQIMDSSIVWTTMPSPLYEEKDEYLSYSASYNLNFAGIPADCRDVDKSTYLYEVFMALSYDTVYPAYYEKCFQTRYQPTTQAAQVFDMIAESRVVCMADIYRLYEGTPISHMIGRVRSDGWSPEVGSCSKQLHDTIVASMTDMGW